MRALKSQPVDVSAELSKLNHNEKQNKQLPRLPANVTIARRPMNHAPVSSPFAGPQVQKVVYVSCKTPIMSSVKRVKKFLREIEKRAMQSQGVEGVLDRSMSRGSRGGEHALHKKLEDVSEKLRRDAEEVLVKASGRAMEQALRIGEWFRNKEEEILTKVEVRTGSVSVVDDIVENDESVQLEAEDSGIETETGPETSTVLECGDTTMELLETVGEGQSKPSSAPRDKAEQRQEASNSQSNLKGESTKRRRRKKRKAYDMEDIPEARLRWVKTIEIAISLRM